MGTSSRTICRLFFLVTLLTVNTEARCCVQLTWLPTKWTKATMQPLPQFPKYPGFQFQHGDRPCLNSRWDFLSGATTASSVKPSVPTDFEGKSKLISVPYRSSSEILGIQLKQNGKTHHKQILS